MLGTLLAQVTETTQVGVAEVAIVGRRLSEHVDRVVAAVTAPPAPPPFADLPRDARLGWLVRTDGGVNVARSSAAAAIALALDMTSGRAQRSAYVVAVVDRPLFVSRHGTRRRIRSVETVPGPTGTHFVVNAERALARSATTQAQLDAIVSELGADGRAVHVFARTEYSIATVRDHVAPDINKALMRELSRSPARVWPGQRAAARSHEIG